MKIQEFNLERDLVVFDLESTGLDVVNDRIVQIGAVKYFADGREPEELNQLIHPTIKIPEESIAIHGITNADVADAPTFEELSDKLISFFKGADLSGYNAAKFDIPLLMEEFNRVDFVFTPSKVNVVDVQRIFFQMEPRTLAGAVRFYCKENMENAHDALADVKATIKVLEAQVDHYKDTDCFLNDGSVKENPIVPDIKALAEFTTNKDQVDAQNRLKRDADGEICFNFGKYKGQKVHEVFRKESNYYFWMQSKDFTAEVKLLTKEIFEKVLNNK